MDRGARVARSPHPFTDCGGDFWTAGFDIIYSCQDYQFDCETGLFSIPSRLGIAPALMLARALHVAMIASLLLLVYLLALGGTGSGRRGGGLRTSDLRAQPGEGQ